MQRQGRRGRRSADDCANERGCQGLVRQGLRTSFRGRSIRDLDDIGGVGVDDGLFAVGNGHARLTRNLHGDSIAARGVVEEDVGLVDRRNLNRASRRQSPCQSDDVVAARGRRTVWDSQNRRYAAVRDRLRGVARNGLLKERSKVRIGRRTPCTGLVTRANQFELEVCRIGTSHHVSPKRLSGSIRGLGMG